MIFLKRYKKYCIAEYRFINFNRVYIHDVTNWEDFKYIIRDYYRMCINYGKLMTFIYVSGKFKMIIIGNNKLDYDLVNICDAIQKTLNDHNIGSKFPSEIIHKINKLISQKSIYAYISYEQLYDVLITGQNNIVFYHQYDFTGNKIIKDSIVFITKSNSVDKIVIDNYNCIKINLMEHYQKELYDILYNDMNNWTNITLQLLDDYTSTKLTNKIIYNYSICDLKNRYTKIYKNGRKYKCVMVEDM